MQDLLQCVGNIFLTEDLEQKESIVGQKMIKTDSENSKHCP